MLADFVAEVGDYDDASIDAIFDAGSQSPKDTPKQEERMATRQIKMPVKESSKQEVGEEFSQSKRPERGRFLLQVDRQTKGSYTTLEAAQAAALIIKKKYPIVKVAVYDSIDNSDTLVEPPAASS
jgi:hypothetical protein